MPTTPPQTAFLPAAWAEALDGIQHALDQAIASATEREQALQTPAEEPDSDRDAFWCLHLQKLDERLALIESSGQKPGQSAAAADAALAACETTVKEWLITASATGQKLASWAGREYSDE